MRYRPGRPSPRSRHCDNSMGEHAALLSWPPAGSARGAQSGRPSRRPKGTTRRNAQRRLVGREPWMLPQGEGHTGATPIDELGLDRDPVRLKAEALSSGVTIDVVDSAIIEDELRVPRVGRADTPGRAPARAVEVKAGAWHVRPHAPDAPVEGEAIIADAIGEGRHREHARAKSVR